MNSIFNFFKKEKTTNKMPSTEELIERGFAPKNGKIDILLIFPPTSVAGRYGRDDIGEIGGDVIPLGIAMLAAYLREKGFGVGVLDCPGLRIDSEKVFEIITEKDPDIIAFSTSTYTLFRAIEIAKKIRSKSQNKLILLGGSHANVAAEETVDQYDYFDIVSYGKDGELIIHDIVAKYKEKNCDRNLFMSDHEILKSIKGIIYKINNVAIRNEEAENIPDLDVLPFPARDLFPLERYIPLPNQYKRLPATNMVVIRGCPYSCSFCDQAFTGARRSSPQRAVAEIKHCVEVLGIREISFWDDMLCYHKKWMKEFLNLLIEENLDFTWSCYAAVNTVDEELLKLMGKAGCWNIFYGFETAVDVLAKNINTVRKNKSLEKMKQVVSWTKAAGIEVRGSFMVGMPGETPELGKQTIQNAIELDPDYAQFGIVCPFPGTQLYKEIKQGKWGKFLTENFEDYNMWQPTWLPDGYQNINQLKEMEKLAYTKFYLRPKYVFGRIKSIKSFEDIKRYFKGAIGLIKGGYISTKFKEI
tara:strand:+ start:3788 stop:5371 length:1584 start_codon:yes stop_codon:yes gene_type:complete